MTEEERVTVYTVGHSSLSAEELLARLVSVGVTVVVDLRSQPYSRWAPQHNRENLQRSLHPAGIAYRYLGELLGGRPLDPTLYAAGRVERRPDYDLLRRTPEFCRGVAEVLALARQPTTVVAMLCSEGDPGDCHRHLAVAPALCAEGVRVVHLLPDGGMDEAREEPRQMSLF